MRDLKSLLMLLFLVIGFTACGDNHNRAEGLSCDDSRLAEANARITELEAELAAADDVQLGGRPFFLVQDMDESSLKTQLQDCAEGPFSKSELSIGHRGAPMQFPEHTRESYVAAARMGAGILECDVAFTKDLQLVCRHAQCDLHQTTDILTSPLASKCTQTFIPGDPDTSAKAQVKCCTSDLTLAEFKSLCGKMDAKNDFATTPEEYIENATAPWRTDLYATCGTLMSHKESIELFESLGVKMTPELKDPEPDVSMPFNGYTREQYAQQLIDEYKAAGVDPGSVYAQSFRLEDVEYWIANEADFGKQAVFLDGRYATGLDPSDPSTFNPTMQDLVDKDVKILAPPTNLLVTLDASDNIVPSEYAKEAKKVGLDLITWTLERSGPLADLAATEFYYRSIYDAVNNDGDMFHLIDALAQDVGVIGIFSDWAATVTYYANCMGLK